MSDSFKDELAKIKRETAARIEEQKQKSLEQQAHYKREWKAMVDIADTFDQQVVRPVLDDFTEAVGVEHFQTTFNGSESQPTFIHTACIDEQQGHEVEVNVSLLFWVAGSAQLSCEIGMWRQKKELKLESLKDQSAKDKATTWLKESLLELYQEHSKRKY